jgi:hypothetical protein
MMRRHRPSSFRVRLAFFLATAVCGSGLLIAGSAGGATTNSLYQIDAGYGDFFYNYDFTTTNGAGWNTVDWGISLLFYNNAEIDKVKGQVSGYPFGASVASPMWAYMWNNGTWGPGYDEDSGKKTDTPSCLGSTRHFRIYAPPTTDRFYNPSFGYYVIASTHYDHHELCNDWYDDSEGTEHDVGNRVGHRSGNGVWHDWGYLYNYQWYDEGNHHWRQNGYATYVYVG